MELPLSLSIVTADGMSCKVLERGTHLPASKAIVFSTGKTIPPSVCVEIMAGERLMAKSNISIKKLRLPGIRKTVGEVARIAVKVDVSDDGTIALEAFDYGSHHKASCIIEPSWIPDEATINASLRDTSLHKDDDNFFSLCCTALTRADAMADRVASFDKAKKEKYTKEELQDLKMTAKELKKTAKKLKAENMSRYEFNELNSEVESLISKFK